MSTEGKSETTGGKPMKVVTFRRHQGEDRIIIPADDDPGKHVRPELILKVQEINGMIETTSPKWSGVRLCPWCKNILIRECDVLVCRNIAWHYGSVMFMQNDQEAKPDVR